MITMFDKKVLKDFYDFWTMELEHEGEYWTNNGHYNREEVKSWSKTELWIGYLMYKSYRKIWTNGKWVNV